MTVLYFGSNSNYATCPHTTDGANAALVVIPSTPHNQVATGIFSYNIYVSAVFDGTQIQTARVRLYCGPQSSLSLITPAWFGSSTCQLINEWGFGPCGPEVAMIPPAPVASATWAVEMNGNPFPVWDPTGFNIFGQAFALVATLDYQTSSGGEQTITSGVSLRKDPCAAVCQSNNL